MSQLSIPTVYNYTRFCKNRSMLFCKLQVFAGPTAVLHSTRKWALHKSVNLLFPCPSFVIRNHPTVTLPLPTSPNLHNVWCCTHRLMVSSPRYAVMSEISAVIIHSELCWGIRRGPMALSSVLWDIHPQLQHHDNNSDIVCLVALSYTR